MMQASPIAVESFHATAQEAALQIVAQPIRKAVVRPRKALVHILAPPLRRWSETLFTAASEAPLRVRADLAICTRAVP